MAAILVSFDFGDRAEMARDLVRGSKSVSGLEAVPQTAEPVEGSKAGFGDVVATLLEITTKAAIGPTLGLLRYFVSRDRTNAKVHLKLADGTEMDLEFSNLDVQLERLEHILMRLLEKAPRKADG